MTAVPSAWSLAQAASVPVVFLTALYGLSVLAVSSPVSACWYVATGGVGMAAVQLCRHWGAEVFVTASRGKWATLQAMGLDDAHIGDSRTLEFEQKFLAATDEPGSMSCSTRWPVSSSMPRCGCWSAAGDLSRWVKLIFVTPSR